MEIRSSSMKEFSIKIMLVHSNYDFIAMCLWGFTQSINKRFCVIVIAFKNIFLLWNNKKSQEFYDIIIIVSKIFFKHKYCWIKDLKKIYSKIKKIEWSLFIQSRLNICTLNTLYSFSLSLPLQDFYNKFFIIIHLLRTSKMYALHADFSFQNEWMNLFLS